MTETWAFAISADFPSERAIMGKLIEWISGKKTYIVAGLVGVGAAAAMLGYTVPDWTWMILAGLGLGSVRAAVDKIKP